MEDYSQVKYSNSFLNQVIIRADFLEFVETDNILSTKIEKSVLPYFPKRGKDQIVRFNSINFMFDGTGSQSVQNANKKVFEGIQREYYDQNGKNKIIISNKNIVFEINDHISFEDHMQGLQKILSSIFEDNKLTVIRTGIRYINIYDSERIRLRKNYFSSEIASILTTKIAKDESGLSLIRSMHLSEYRIDDMILNFRYGMFNPEYPNLLKKNSFALDFDCYCSDPINTYNEIIQCIKKGHDAIQSLFESAITDSLRKVMKNHE